MGLRVKTRIPFSGIPAGTEGVIDQIDERLNHDTVVAWDLPDSPLPPGYQEYDGRPAIQSGILRDWFADYELQYLEVVG